MVRMQIIGGVQMENVQIESQTLYATVQCDVRLLSA